MPYPSLALTIPLAAALLLLAVPAGIAGLRGRSGSLSRKGRLGLHTPAAQASDGAFTLANRVAAPLELGAGVVGIVCAALVIALPVGTAGAIAVALLGLAGIFGQLMAASNLGERAARTVPLPARKPGSDGGGCCGGCGCGDGGCAAQGSSSAAAGPAADAANVVIPDLVADAPLR